MQPWHPTQRSASITDNRFGLAIVLSSFAAGLVALHLLFHVREDVVAEALGGEVEPMSGPPTSRARLVRGRAEVRGFAVDL
jgi:hypothetical protein